MILRRVTEHAKAQKWFAIALELSLKITYIKRIVLAFY